MTGATWTTADVLALGVRTDLQTAASVLGIGRTKANELARRGELPFPVLKIGARYVVPTAGLLTLLGLEKKDETPPDSGVVAATTTDPSEVDHRALYGLHRPQRVSAGVSRLPTASAGRRP